MIGLKTIEHIGLDFHEKSAQTDLSQKMWALISKGLKHLNTVLYVKIIMKAGMFSGKLKFHLKLLLFD